MWEMLLPPDKSNRVPLSLNCLLIRSEGKTILVDTGLGDHLTDRQHQIYGLARGKNDGLIQALARLGITPEKVDLVINTHLHADHCGGNMTRRDEGRELIPTFSNAEYWIQRMEWADAAFPNERTRATYLAHTSEVRTVVTRGHTRAHQSIVIESGGEAALYTGDLATLAVHFERLAWVTAYDVEPLETIETKRLWQRWALEQNALIILPHDTQTPLARLRQDTEGKTQLEPITPVPIQQ
jgi:glyoxylase-like metal-dependent hydrolase (beta-lactamase superfamily II)